MLEILDAELLEDIAANLLVVSCPHLGEGVCGLFIPLLAFSQEQVEEAGAVGTLLKKESVEIHGG
jgi:hypothetical protein